MNARISLALALVLVAVAIPATATAQEVRKLVASDGLPGDRFGTSIDVDGDTLLVGAPFKDSFWQGKAYTFDLKTGLQEHMLKAPDAANSDKFGWAVAITPSLLVVSSPNDTIVQGVTVNVGSLSLFDRVTGASLGKVFASDASTSDQLGFSLAADGEVVVASAAGDKPGGVWSGSAYVFDLAQGTETKLVPADGANFDSFGYSVDIGGGYIAIGAPSADRFGTDSGTVYIFDATTGVELYQIQPIAALPGDYFGGSVAIDGTRLVVSFEGNKNERKPMPSNRNSSVWVFDLATGQELFRLKIHDKVGDRLGFDSLGIDGDRILVGMARANEPVVWSGATYAFDSATGTPLDKLLPSDPSKYKYFGSSVAFSTKYAFIGADGDLSSQGSVYVFVRP